MYPQDAIMPLPLEEADVVVGDFPIGYYPLDERSKEMKLDLKKAIVIHTFTHRTNCLCFKTKWLCFLVVPSNIFEDEHVKQLQNFITTETEMQAFLNLPKTLFKMKMHVNQF